MNEKDQVADAIAAEKRGDLEMIGYDSKEALYADLGLPEES